MRARAPFDHIFKMDHYPEEGETLRLTMDIGRVQQMYYGDCSLNVAAAAATLGVKTTAATLVGEDFETEGYLAHLHKLGIGTEGVDMKAGALSGHNHLYFDEAGDGFCFSHLGAAEVQDDARVPGDLPHRAAYVVASEMFSPYTLDALKRGKAAGATCVLNGMVDTADELVEDFLTAADILFINQSEYGRLLQKLGGGEDVLFTRFGLRLVFCTKGRKGCDILQPGGTQHAGITPAERRVDTTGAGDSFCAGTLAGLIRGLHPVQAARLGSTVSSFVIEDWGCQTRLPSWAEAADRYQNHYKEALPHESD